MIRIASQSGSHQYDQDGRAITEWNEKACSWIVLPEFENEKIDWYGQDSDFPAGTTRKQLNIDSPGWETNPVIAVTWYWNDKGTAIKAFGQPNTFGERPDYWKKQQYPYTCRRSWEYLNYKPDEAIKSLGTYCNFNRYADRTVVIYNGEIIHDGKLEEKPAENCVL